MSNPEPSKPCFTKVVNFKIQRLGRSPIQQVHRCYLYLVIGSPMKNYLPVGYLHTKWYKIFSIYLHKLYLTLYVNIKHILKHSPTLRYDISFSQIKTHCLKICRVIKRFKWTVSGYSFPALVKPQKISLCSLDYHPLLVTQLRYKCTPLYYSNFSVAYLGFLPPHRPYAPTNY